MRASRFSTTLEQDTRSTRLFCYRVTGPRRFLCSPQGWEYLTVHGGMSPEQKVEIVREITAKRPTLYLGDGINDAPAMLNATAGVALGVNSDITSEAAGAVILQASLASVDELIHIGSRMRRIAITSAVGGMTLSLAGMCAASAGYLSPIQGALLQEAIDLLSILNSLRMILPVGPLSDFRLPGPPREGLPTGSARHTSRCIAMDGDFKRRTTFVVGVCAGVAVAALLAWTMRVILLLLFAGLIGALLLTIMASWIEKWLKLRRSLALSMVVACFAICSWSGDMDAGHRDRATVQRSASRPSRRRPSGR